MFVEKELNLFVGNNRRIFPKSSEIVRLRNILGTYTFSFFVKERQSGNEHFGTVDLGQVEAMFLRERELAIKIMENFVRPQE